MTAQADESVLRREIIAAAKRMSREGLSPGKSGNVSARFKDGMLITPSGLPYENMAESGIVFVGARGKSPPGSRKPSSEWRMHLAIYDARPEAQAIVHCHSLHATALACAHKSIPAFHYMVAIAGGSDIPLAPYATFGTAELGQKAAEVLKNRKACLLANHGQIATGASLEAALDLAREVETLAAQYTAALALGAPHILDDAEMERVLAKFATYGQEGRAKSKPAAKSRG